MENLLNKLDWIAGIETDKQIALWLERLAFIFLILMTLSAPHSIAATQISYILGMIFWIARFFIKPRPSFNKTILFLPFLLFLFWSIVTSAFSYAPDISFDKLRNVTLFFIFFFTINNLRKVRSVNFIAFALVFSCMVNVVWTPIVRLIGRGVEIQNIQANSPLKKAEMQNGDTIIKINDKKVSSPEDIFEEMEKSRDTFKINFYRPDFYLTKELKKSDLLAGDTVFEKLGFEDWKKSRNWRSAGFYGHYATYAEVLQLIGSLVLGLFIAGIVKNSTFNIQHSTLSILLFCSSALMALALLLTVTRASQLALMISAFSIVLLGASRKMLLILVALAIPIVIGGLIFLQQARNVQFFDSKDNSTTWRQVVYKEAFDLWTENPRHFSLGVGMDSIKRYKEEWGLFDNGKLPPGHLHSTPLQLVVERGLPALLLWLWILGAYKVRMLKFLRQKEFDDWVEKGIVLGAFGGLIGFFVSGLVHYNLGDGEVAMVFYLIMALAIRVVCKEDFITNNQL